MRPSPNLEHPFQESGSVEKGEISGTLSGADESWLDTSLPCDSDCHPPFARAVQFCENESRQRGCSVEFPGLHDGIAPGSRVGYQKDLMWSCGIQLAERSSHLGKFLHKI